MTLEASLKRLVETFHAAGVDFALIGGLALAARGVPRATGDLDFLVPFGLADRLDEVMRSLGYACSHRTENVAQYTAPTERVGDVDVLYARRPYSLAMLARAPAEDLGMSHPVKVVQTEDLIGLKVQSSSNDPRRRTLDMADIERLLGGGEPVDMERIREYFGIFEREAELDDLLRRLKR